METTCLTCDNKFPRSSHFCPHCGSVNLDLSPNELFNVTQRIQQHRGTTEDHRYMQALADAQKDLNRRQPLASRASKNKRRSITSIVGTIVIGIVTCCAFLIAWGVVNDLILRPIFFNSYSLTRVSPAVSSPTGPPIPISTKTPMPAKPRTDCTRWDSLRQNNIGETVCVHGLANRITGNDAQSEKLRIYFDDNLPLGYTWRDGTPAIFYFVDETHYYEDLNEGDCVSATGLISINDQGGLFMRVDGNLQKC